MGGGTQQIFPVSNLPASNRAAVAESILTFTCVTSPRDYLLPEVEGYVDGPY